MTTTISNMSMIYSDAIDAELRRFAVCRHIDPAVLPTRESFEFAQRSLCGQMVHELIHYVYAVESKKLIDFHARFEVPASWLDAFKERFERWIPKWYLRWRPVQYRVLEKHESHMVTAQALLPKIPIRGNYVRIIDDAERK